MNLITLPQTDEMDVEEKKRKTERDLEAEHGGPGTYNYDMRKNYTLDNPDWKYDEYPEIINGMNLFDYIDPEIGRKLEELEKEEAELVKEWEKEEALLRGHDDLLEDEKELADWILKKRKLMKQQGELQKTNNKPKVPSKFKTKNIKKAEEKLQEIGLETSKFRSSSLAKSRKRKLSIGGYDHDIDMENNNNDDDGHIQTRGRSRSAGRRSLSVGDDRSQSLASLRSKSAAARSRSRNRTPSVGPGTGFSDLKVHEKAVKMSRKAQRTMNQDARQGEADRHYYESMPKHLFSGKRGRGKTDRR